MEDVTQKKNAEKNVVMTLIVLIATVVQIVEDAVALINAIDQKIV